MAGSGSEKDYTWVFIDRDGRQLKQLKEDQYPAGKGGVKIWRSMG